MSKHSRIPVYSLIIFLIILCLFAFIAVKHSAFTQLSAPTRSVTQVTSITYKGKNGKDALSLLKNITSVKQNQSGLIVEIDGRSADNAAHEYWEFFINGKPATVGPADYQTKDGDTLSWKIATY